jgi:hypothetical protein
VADIGWQAERERDLETSVRESRCVFFLGILCYSRSGDDPQKDLAKFGYKLNMKAIFLKTHPSIFLANLLEACIERSGDISLKFSGVTVFFWLIEKYLKPHDFSTFNF